MNIEAHPEATIPYVIVNWPEGYTFGDSFQHAQGKFAAARALGLKTSTTKLFVATAVVKINRVTQTVWAVR